MAELKGKIKLPRITNLSFKNSAYTRLFCI